MPHQAPPTQTARTALGLTPWTVAGFVAAALSGDAIAQWDPTAGEWGREVQTDVRVMTWNVEDFLCTSNDERQNFDGDWSAAARIIAGLLPDIILLQETGDNSGNGTGFGVDSISELESVSDLFFFGGTDIYNGNQPVADFVARYTDFYDDGIHVFVSSDTDGFNRNVIISRFPFTDLNGDNTDRISDGRISPATGYAGGSFGVRGYQFAEIDLPDGVYGGDLVVGNGHLKAGSNGSDSNQRIDAAQNIAYFIDVYFNGAGTGLPDPFDNVTSIPETNSPPQSILPPGTAVIWGGDINQDEDRIGKGPARWLAEAEFPDSLVQDGTDRDRSDAAFDDSRDPLGNNRGTLGSSKLDYLFWQDSIVEPRRTFVFDSTESTSSTQLPLPLRSFPFNPRVVSAVAADHFPVIGDFIIADPPACLGADLNFDGGNSLLDGFVFLDFYDPADPADITDLDSDGDNDIVDAFAFLDLYDPEECPVP